MFKHGKHKRSFQLFCCTLQAALLIKNKTINQNFNTQKIMACIISLDYFYESDRRGFLSLKVVFI